jgi:hypothetical protein
VGKASGKKIASFIAKYARMTIALHACKPLRTATFAKRKKSI